MPTDPAEATAGRIEAYEAHVRALARSRIGADIARIQAQFRVDVTNARAVNDPKLLVAARKRAAASLKALRPNMAPELRQAVAEGTRLGAELAGGPLPDGVKPLTDPAIKVTLQRMNTPIRQHARQSAAHLLTAPLRTDAQLEQAIARIGAVLAEVDAAAGVITTRAVDIGTTAVTETVGVARIWVTRSGCCPMCASYAGAVAAPGRGFRPRARYGDRHGQWEDDDGGIAGPGLHFHCRCYTVPYAPRLADRLARQAEEDVAAGKLAASTPARIRAIERMLTEDARLTQRTRERAIKAAARGRFAAQRAAS